MLSMGVAYGSDVPLVLRLLREAADECTLVLKTPEAQVFFMEFGDSSLNFELRVWVGDFETRFRVRSELNQTIDRTFRENDVEIPFPQRDLHLRTVDEPARTALSRANQV